MTAFYRLKFSNTFALSLFLYLLPATLLVTRAAAQTEQREDIQQVNSAQKMDVPATNAAAIQAYKELVQNADTDSLTRLQAFKKLIDLYGFIADIESALQVREEMSRWVKDSTIIVKCNLQLAQFLMQNHDFKTARIILEQVYAYFEKRKDLLWMAKVTGTEATALKAEGNIALALEKAETAWRLIREHKKAASIADDNAEIADLECTAINNIADVLLEKHDYKAVISLLDKTAPLLQWARESTRAVVYISYAQAYQGLGKNSEAKVLFLNGAALVEQGNYRYLKPAYLEIAKFLTSQGDYKEATAFFEKYISNNEETQKQELLQRLGYARTQYLLEKKDREIVESELKLLRKNQQLVSQQKQTLFWILGSLTLLAIVLLLYRNSRVKTQLLKTRLKMQDTEKAMLEAEGVLKGELQERGRIARELHDNVVSELTVLKLNLEVLHGQADSLKAAESTKATLHHSTEILEQLRRTAHNMIPEEDGLQSLSQQAALFVSRLQHTRTRFSYQEIGEEPSLSLYKKKIILMVIRELVHNIIRHSKATEALVQLHFCPELLMITVEDNGTGMEPDTETVSEGMGWKNVRENVALLHGFIDLKSSEYEGTNILVEIPV